MACNLLLLLLLLLMMVIFNFWGLLLLHNEELNDLCFSPNIVLVIKSRRM